MSEFECRCGRLLSSRERHHGCDKCGATAPRFMDGYSRTQLEKMEQYDSEGEEAYDPAGQLMRGD